MSGPHRLQLWCKATQHLAQQPGSRQWQQGALVSLQKRTQQNRRASAIPMGQVTCRLRAVTRTVKAAKMLRQELGQLTLRLSSLRQPAGAPGSSQVSLLLQQAFLQSQSLWVSTSPQKPERSLRQCRWKNRKETCRRAMVSPRRAAIRRWQMPALKPRVSCLLHLLTVLLHVILFHIRPMPCWLLHGISSLLKRLSLQTFFLCSAILGVGASIITCPSVEGHRVPGISQAC